MIASYGKMVNELSKTIPKTGLFINYTQKKTAFSEKWKRQCFGVLNYCATPTRAVGQF